MLEQRASGILLHPTSLPGPTGVGELGDAAFEFVDFLARAGQTYWQVLPLGPTGYGDSPYASFSSFAGNPYLISIDRLLRDGDLTADQIPTADTVDPGCVDFGAVFHWKYPLLQFAAGRFLRDASPQRRQAFEEFCHQQAYWLDDYARFMAIKEYHDSKAGHAGVSNSLWNHYWPADIARREQAAIDHWADKLQVQIEIQKVWQFYFEQQWQAVRSYANERGIQIIGDIPIFVAQDSADVWASPDSFLLDERRRPTVVAGVPPDYFSATGQRWGNPLYNWPAMEQDGFRWWIDRIRGTLRLVDVVRVDHFRGFEAYWAIPSSESTAVNGTWQKAPGDAFFRRMKEVLGPVPVLAEDLGLITPEVEQLRDDHGFPGMRVLQFAFDQAGDRDNIFLPHNYERNCVVYTGTHDNDTTLGWYRKCSSEDRAGVCRYLGWSSDRSDHDVAQELSRVALSSVAALVVLPMQDVLGLDSWARMNTPAVSTGNWQWRMVPNYDEHGASTQLADWVDLYQRRPASATT